MNKPQLLTGARGFIQKKNGDGTMETMAFATDISVNVRAGVRPTFVVGKMNAATIDSLSYDVDVSVGRVVPVNKSDDPTKTVAITAIENNLEPLIASMTTADDLEIAIYDKVTEKYITAVRGCRFAGRGLAMNAGDVASESLSFVGIWDAGYNSSENSGDVIVGYGV